MRKWTAEERARQSELIQKWKPWERSTGAKTPEGKAASSQNALIHGAYNLNAKLQAKQLNDLVRASKACLRKVRE